MPFFVPKQKICKPAEYAQLFEINAYIKNPAAAGFLTVRKTILEKEAAIGNTHVFDLGPHQVSNTQQQVGGWLILACL
jgi:hypothetical protein